MDNNTFDIILGEFVEVVKPNYKGIQNWVNRRDPHQCGHIDFITSGQMNIEINGEKHKVCANQILCIPKNKSYTCYVKQSAYSYYSFHFEYTTAGENTEFPFPVVFTPENLQYIKDKFKYAYQLSITQPYGYKIRIRELFYDVFTRINEEHFNRQGYNSGVYTIRKSVEFIDKNFDSPSLSSSDIVDMSGISKTHFRRIFKKSYGMTPTEYINKLRINKAKTLLVNSNLSIEQIAYKCGYHEYSYFARVFSKITGMTPRGYRASADTEILI